MPSEKRFLISEQLLIMCEALNDKKFTFFDREKIAQTLLINGVDRERIIQSFSPDEMKSVEI